MSLKLLWISFKTSVPLINMLSSPLSKKDNLYSYCMYWQQHTFFLLLKKVEGKCLTCSEPYCFNLTVVGFVLKKNLSACFFFFFVFFYLTLLFLCLCGRAFIRSVLFIASVRPSFDVERVFFFFLLFSKFINLFLT